MAQAATPSGSNSRCLPVATRGRINWTYEILDEPPTEYDLKKARNIGGRGMQMNQQGLVISEQSWANIATGFEARPITRMIGRSSCLMN